MEFNAVEAAGLLMFLIGLYGLMARRNILKSILCLGVMDIGVILFFLGIRFEAPAQPPIEPVAAGAVLVDPVPQALMITAIVIGIAVTAVALVMFSALYHRYGTHNWHTAWKIRHREEER